jgi:hypothetical protein
MVAPCRANCISSPSKLPPVTSIEKKPRPIRLATIGTTSRLMPNSGMSISAGSGVICATSTRLRNTVGNGSSLLSACSIHRDQWLHPFVVDDNGLACRLDDGRYQRAHAAILCAQLHQLVANLKPALFRRGWRADQHLHHVALDVTQRCALWQGEERDRVLIGGGTRARIDSPDHADGRYIHLHQIVDQIGLCQLVAEQMQRIDGEQLQFVPFERRKRRRACVQH